MGRHLQSGEKRGGCRDGRAHRERLQHLYSGGLGSSRGKRAGTPHGHHVDLDSVLCPRMALLVCGVASRACGFSLLSGSSRELGFSSYFESLLTNSPFFRPSTLVFSGPTCPQLQPVWSEFLIYIVGVETICTSHAIVQTLQAVKFYKKSFIIHGVILHRGISPSIESLRIFFASLLSTYSCCL